MRVKQNLAKFFLIFLLAFSMFSSTVAVAFTDPLEPINRAVYSFNSVLDKGLVRPIAVGYKYIIPDPIRGGISNFLRNMGEPTTFVNDILQGEAVRARNSLGRFVINSTVGVLGLLDIATRLNIPYHKEDYGQTLAIWGVPSGPYLVLPFMGPSTIRDTVGRIPEVYFNDLMWSSQDNDITLTRTTVGAINTRSQYLELDRLIALQVDPYIFVRNSYLSNRQKAVLNDQITPDPKSKQIETELLQD